MAKNSYLGGFCQLFRGMRPGRPEIRTIRHNTFVFEKIDDEYIHIRVERENKYRDKVTVWEKDIKIEYSEVIYTLSRLFETDFSEKVDALEETGIVSKSDLYNYCINNFNEYGLNLSDKREMLVLLNVMEAQGETLEDLGDYTSTAFDFNCSDRSDAAEWFIETNAFFDGWNDYASFLIDDGEDLAGAKEYLEWSLFNSNLAITTDGIVEIGVV